MDSYIKMVLRETGWKVSEWIHLAKKRLSVVMILRVQGRRGISCISELTASQREFSYIE